MSEQDPVRFSEKIADSIAKLYKIGGFGLVFIFVAFIAMGIAFFYPEGDLSRWSFILGAIMMFASFVMFTIVQIKGLRPARNGINMNKETIDEVQDLSISLIDLTSKTQSYCFKHLEKIQFTIDKVLPVVKMIPGQKAKNFAIEVEDVSEGIVEYSEAIKKTIEEIKDALENGDFETVAVYTQKVRGLNEKLNEALKRN